MNMIDVITTTYVMSVNAHVDFDLLKHGNKALATVNSKFGLWPS